MVHTLPSSMISGSPGTHTPDPSHVSSPLHRFSSEHETPAGCGVVVHPTSGSQIARKQGSLVEHTGACPGVHAPAPSQISSPLQAFPSEHDAPSGRAETLHPLIGSQTAARQGLSVEHGSVFPGAQVPSPSHVHSLMHASPSAHGNPAGMGFVAHPINGSQYAARHGLSVSHGADFPGEHAPFPSHVSSPLHASPSEHDVPSGFGKVVHPLCGSRTAVRHGLSVQQGCASPGVHTPAPSHVSWPLQALPSEHDVPFGFGDVVQPICGSQ